MSFELAELMLTIEKDFSLALRLGVVVDIRQWRGVWWGSDRRGVMPLPVERGGFLECAMVTRKCRGRL